MGTLRFLFTLTILLGHIYSIHGFRYHELLSSPIAFESFFILSGFSIAMVLDEKYGGEKKLFAWKRFVRIFPIYWLILFLTILFSAGSYLIAEKPLLLNSFMAHWNDLNLLPQVWILFSNLLIIGQEALFFLKFNYVQGGFEWSNKFIDGDPPIHTFLFVSQAWAISYIIYFYLMAPYLKKLSCWLLVIFALFSLAIRFYAYHLGYQHEPWLYRFFPFELFFFFAGMLSYRALVKIRSHDAMKITAYPVWVVLIAATCLYDLWQVDYLFKQWLFYFMLITGLPFLFYAGQKHRADRTLGDLAYPMYISNFLVINLLGLTPLKSHGILMAAIIGLTILFSYLLMRYYQEPLERYLFNSSKLRQKL